MADEKVQIEIPYGIIEYTATFTRPIVQSFAPPTSMIVSVLDALKPYGYTADGVEVRSREKLTECVVEFRRTPPGAFLRVGPDKLIITAENLDWGDKEKFIAGMYAGIQAVLQVSAAEIASQQMILAMHVQLKNKTRKEVTAPLLSSVGYSLLSGESISQGVILIQENASLLIDASNTYANGLFMRLIRKHSTEQTLEQIAAALYDDEKRVLDGLKLEGDL